SFPFGYPQGVTMENLRVLFEETLFVRWLGNTAFVGVVVVLITLVVAVPAGYAPARLSGPLGRPPRIPLFPTHPLPPPLPFIPLGKVVSTLRLQDSLWALIVTYPSFTIPFCTWLMMGFFKAIPKDIEEAAMVDGMSRLGAFVRVILPMSVAGVLTVVIFTFTL